ncbi:MAG: hypothetical protein BRC26_02365, partial [Nanohaloarchaea archaeon QH_8_44_6]
MQAMSISDAMSNEVIDSVDDLEKTAQIKHSYDLYLHEYLRQGGEFSVNQMSANLGDNGGGRSWEGNIPRYSELYMNLSDGSQAYLNDRYSVDTVVTNCDIPDTTYDLTPWSNKRKGIKYVVNNYEPIGMKCNFGDTEVQYNGSARSFLTYGNTSDNRYLLLANESTYFWGKVREEINSISSGNTGSGRVCENSGSASDAIDEAEEDARDSVEDEVEDAFDEATSVYPKWPGFELTSDSIDVEFEGMDSAETGKSGQCGCAEEERYRTTEVCGTDPKTGDPVTCTVTETRCADHYEYINAEAAVTDAVAEASATIEDAEYRVPISSGWENLDFTVDPYTQGLDFDSSVSGGTGSRGGSGGSLSEEAIRSVDASSSFEEEISAPSCDSADVTI